MKVGFDIHGVIDTFPAFRMMIEKYIEDPDVEVHVITGLSKESAPKEIGHLIDLDRIDGYFSIADYLVMRPDVEVSWIDGLPWSGEVAWNEAKAIYCYENQIDILFDDSPIYSETFKDIDTIYVQIHNEDRKSYKTRPNTGYTGRSK
jgi:hypothetical protein